MKKKADWAPSKYEEVNGTWRSSRREVGIGSRVNADSIVKEYEGAIRQYAKGALLDLGCGDAPLTGLYRDLVTSFVWVDWPNSPHQKYEMDLYADLNAGLALEDKSFDTILLSDVLEHVPNPEFLLLECSRLLKSSGHLVVGVPFLYPLHEEPFDYHRYTIHRLKDLGSKVNLQVLQIKEYAGGLEVVQDMLTKMLSYSAATKWLAYITYGVFKVILWIPYVRKVNNRLRPKFPLGYVAVFGKGI